MNVYTVTVRVESKMEREREMVNKVNGAQLSQMLFLL